MPFQQVQSIEALKPRTTASGYAKLKNWNEEIKKAALFSARTTRKNYLDSLKTMLATVAARGEDPKVIKLKLKAKLAELGYTPEKGFPGDASKWHGKPIPPAKPGSITDLSSNRRLNLIIDTNIKQAQSLGQMATAENPVFLLANPAWELTRVGSRKKPRKDWFKRWKSAGDKVNWVGALKNQFVALKDSPIWKAIGDGVGGFRDTIGEAYPPYAFGSGMGWVNVGRRKWKEMCAKEGVPDQLEGVMQKAKQLKEAQESRGGAGAYGESANPPSLLDLQRGATEGRVDSAVDITFEAPKFEVFHPDTKLMDAIRARIPSALSEIDKVIEKAKKFKDELKVYKEKINKIKDRFIGAKFFTIDTRFDSISNVLETIKDELGKRYITVLRVQNLVERAPVPSDDAGQSKYDLEAAEFGEEIDKALEDARGYEKLVNVREALEQIVEEAETVGHEWAKVECGKFVDEVKAEIDKLGEDAFERIKEEFAKVKKQAKAEGRL